MRITALLATLGVVVALAGQSNADEINWGKVDAALGKTASVQGDVHRYGIPRSDLQVTVDGVTIKPALAHSAAGLVSSRRPAARSSWAISC
jgi:hypothetical protein